MKRLLLFDWIRRHKTATVLLASTAAVVIVLCITRGMGDSQARYITAVAALRSAETLLESKQLAESERRCRHAIEILTALAESSSDRRFRFEQAAAIETLAMIQSAADQPDQADDLYRGAIDLWSRLLADDQTAAEVRWRLARCLSRRAPFLSESGRWEEAESTLERGSIVCRTRIPNAPSDRRVDRQLVSIKNQLGMVFHHTGSWDLALASFDSAVKAQKKVIEASSSTGLDRELLVSSLMNQARTYSATMQRDAAVQLLGEARELAERLSSASGSNARYRDLVAMLLETEANELQGDSRRAALARSLFERAVVIRESLAAGSEVEPEYLDRLARTCGALADSFQGAHSYEKAEEYQRKDLSYQSRLTKEHPEVVAFRFGRGQALHNLAELLRERGRGAEALPLEREAAPLLADVYRENVLDEDRRRAVSYAYWTLCTLELERGEHSAAAQAVSTYQSIEPNGFEEAHEAAGFLCRCIVLCRADHGMPAAEKERLSRSYADRAIGALDTAVRYGYRDLNELTTSRIYEPLRGRPDFSRLVHDVLAIDEALRDG